MGHYCADAYMYGTVGTMFNLTPKRFAQQLPKDLDDTRLKAVLDGKPTLEAVCARIRDGSIRRVIVLCGAGISVNAGIPDFRTKGTGLVMRHVMHPSSYCTQNLKTCSSTQYDNLEEYGLPTPESVFDLDFFQKNPKPFCTLAKTLFPDVYVPKETQHAHKTQEIKLKYKPTRTHHFLGLLDAKGILRRVFTQNIDGLGRFDACCVFLPIFTTACLCLTSTHNLTTHISNAQMQSTSLGSRPTE